jgi:hypothetical protein
VKETESFGGIGGKEEKIKNNQQNRHAFVKKLSGYER